jgi:hypothetical protein
LGSFFLQQNIKIKLKAHLINGHFKKKTAKKEKYVLNGGKKEQSVIKFQLQLF